MHDDRLQGILFSQSPVIDLSHRSRHARIAAKVSLVKQSLHTWTPLKNGDRLYIKLHARKLSDKTDPRTAELLSRLKSRG